MEISEDLAKRIEKAQDELAVLCKGKTFRMCIPVQPDDSDILIGVGLRAGLEAIEELKKAEAKIELLRAGFRHQVNALETLQEMTGSHNEKNPWLGITTAIALDQNKGERIQKELDRLTAAYRRVEASSWACDHLLEVWDEPSSGCAETDLEEVGLAIDLFRKAWRRVEGQPVVMGWIDPLDKMPDELETIQAVFGGKICVAYWQEEQEGDWENGYKKFRQWFRMELDDDHYVSVDGYPEWWKPFSKPPSVLKDNIDNREPTQ